MPSAASLRVPVAGGTTVRVLAWPGAGPTFVLVHGLASNALLWGGVATVLADRGHRVFAVDLRGHGESDPPPAKGYTTALAVADLGAVLTELGVDRPVLAGQSWGGNVVLSYAAGTVAGVPVPHAVAGVDGGWIHLADRFADFTACWAALAPPELRDLTAATFADLLRAGHPDWSADAVAATVANLRPGPDGVLTRRLPLDQHRSILASLYAEPPRAWYPRITCPVLLLPAGDPEGPAGPLVAEAAAALPLPTVRWYPGADHVLHAQHPAAVAADLAGLTP